MSPGTRVAVVSLVADGEGGGEGNEEGALQLRLRHQRTFFFLAGLRFVVVCSRRLLCEAPGFRAEAVFSG